MACRSSSVGVRAGRGGGLRGVSRRVVSPVAVSGRRARVVHYAGRCVEAAPACSAGGEGVRRRRRAVRKEQSGAAVVVASAGAGLEGFWSVVCGTWAGVIGSVRAGAARAARAGGLVIQCNKKRGKGCTNEGGTKKSRARTSGFRVRASTGKGMLTIKRRRAKGRKRLTPATIGRKNK